METGAIEFSLQGKSFKIRKDFGALSLLIISLLLSIYDLVIDLLFCVLSTPRAHPLNSRVRNEKRF